MEDNKDDIIETPFVGEAIIRSKKSSFDEVHILGTKTSMWETLFSRASEIYTEQNDPEIFSQLKENIKDKSLEQSSNLVDVLNKKLSVFYKTDTFCHIIPVGKNQTELWEIFSEILSLVSQNDEISIDITHGLRYQPLIMTIALFYLKSIQNIHINNVYYGALELTNSDFDGKTPILNLNPLTNMISWTNAAFSFSRYGDASAISSLMNFEGNQEFIEKVKYFSSLLSLNAIDKIKLNSEDLIKEANNIDSSKIELIPYKFIKKAFLELPEQVLSIETRWELLLLLSEKYWKNFQYSLSIITAWESLIERVAEILQLNTENFENHVKISHLIRHLNSTKWIANKLNNFRKSIAHAKNKNSPEPKSIVDSFPELFHKLKNSISNQQFEEVIKNEFKIEGSNLVKIKPKRKIKF